MKHTAQYRSNDLVDQLALSERRPVGVELCFEFGGIDQLHMHGGNRSKPRQSIEDLFPGERSISSELAGKGVPITTEGRAPQDGI